MREKQIEEILKDYPIYQYGFLNTDEIELKDEVRTICEQECERYGTSWSCPPAVGTVAECRDRCRRFDRAVLFSTVAEVTDSSNMDEMLKSHKEHERIVHEVKAILAENEEVLALSSDSCTLCTSCTYPENECKFPDKMLPCIESYGILVTSAAEKLEMDFYFDEHNILWFALIFISSF